MVGVDLACFVALWCIGRRCFWYMASILDRYLLSKKIKFARWPLSIFGFLAKNGLRLVLEKWSKNGLKI